MGIVGTAKLQFVTYMDLEFMCLQRSIEVAIWN